MSQCKATSGGKMEESKKDGKAVDQGENGTEISVDKALEVLGRHKEEKFKEFNEKIAEVCQEYGYQFEIQAQIVAVPIGVRK